VSNHLSTVAPKIIILTKPWPIPPINVLLWCTSAFEAAAVVVGFGVVGQLMVA
ncbi:hypothetical protein Ddye_027527, partial [Dipteronia dyeriana]